LGFAVLLASQALNWKKRSCRAGSGLSRNAASSRRHQQIRPQCPARLSRH